MALVLTPDHRRRPPAYETPQEVFDKLDAEFHFTLDAAATHLNKKCVQFYDEDTNGLTAPWQRATFCNPPYGRGIKDWVQKAYDESLKGNLSVLLLPARTDVRWFHQYIYKQPNVEVRFIKGRLKFNHTDPAPFPSMVVIFKPT